MDNTEEEVEDMEYRVFRRVVAVDWGEGVCLRRLEEPSLIPRGLRLGVTYGDCFGDFGMGGESNECVGFGGGVLLGFVISFIGDFLKMMAWLSGVNLKREACFDVGVGSPSSGVACVFI